MGDSDSEELRLLQELRALQDQFSRLRGPIEESPVHADLQRRKPRVIIASYDLPVSAPIWSQNESTIPSGHAKGGFAAEKGSSNFVFNPNLSREESFTLGSFLNDSTEFEHVWVGGLDVQSFELSELQNIQQDLMENHRCIPVFAYGETFDLHYNGFCKNVLWPLLHGIPPTRLYTKTPEDSVDVAWKAYLEVNEAFAQQILQIFNPLTDIIWVHDYHLFLLPFILKQQIPESTIGFFLHTSFSSSEIFRILPYRKQVLQGMLASDLIGMQTYTHARQFLASCSRILGLESSPSGIEREDGHFTHLRICPVGIDEKALQANLKEPEMISLVSRLRAKYGTRKLIVGIGMSIAGLARLIHY